VANLVCQVGIVVTGGLVRLTGSGLGCPSWPQCVPGSYRPVVEQPEGYHKYIEFGNRLLTFVLVVVAVATLVAVLRATRSPLHPGSTRRDLVVLAAAPVVGVLAQALLGGLTVLTGLHPATVAAHFLLSMLLVAVSTVLVLRLRRPVRWERAVPQEVGWLAAGLTAVAAVVLVLGTVVTGSGPHSGDAETPARFGIDPRTVSWLHADAVLLFVGLVVAVLVAFRLVDAPRPARRRGLVLAVVTLAQGVLGYVQYATDLPEALVATHMAGACLLVVAVTTVVVAVRDGRSGTAPLVTVPRERGTAT
jgi:cytochrome c oxidase assembly protein subunit 15